MCKVTVLTAVYNAAPYLAQCLDSLLAQTLADFEVVCVDDASTDDSPRILAEYADRDDRVRVVRLDENGGQAKARNMALRMARGEYVCMLDADDWMAPDALQQAADILDSHATTDCVLFQVREVGDGAERDYPMPPFECIDGQTAFEWSLTWRIHGLYMTRAALHRQFPYDNTARSYSDDNTTRMHYLHSREVRQCQGMYFYRQHAASVTHHVGVRRFDYLRANESMRRQMVEAGVEPRLLATYERVRWLCLVDVYMFYFNNRRRLDADARRYGLGEMRRVWSTIDTQCLPRRLRWKFGYMPCRPSWILFRIQEEAYFSLRRLLGRG